MIEWIEIYGPLVLLLVVSIPLILFLPAAFTIGAARGIMTELGTPRREAGDRAGPQVSRLPSPPAENP
jgi:hypothetical protein